MFVKLKRFFLSFSFIWIFLVFPKSGLALPDKVIVTRQEVLDVGKEIHPPGCTDSRTADYCQLSTAYEVRGEIRELLEQGMNKEQTIHYLVDKYGERILASPTTEGFNLVAWLLPGVGLFIGIILVGYLIYRWVKKEPEQSNVKTSLSAITEEELKVKQELKNWL